jgi:hypothetical protein
MFLCIRATILLQAVYLISHTSRNRVNMVLQNQAIQYVTEQFEFQPQNFQVDEVTLVEIDCKLPLSLTFLPLT